MPVLKTVGSSIETGAGVATAATSGATAGSTAATVGAAASVVGLLAVPVLLLLGRIFRGADPRQVPAAQIEQAFEGASNNLYHVGRAGMLSRDEVVGGMRALLAKGEQYFAEALRNPAAFGSSEKALKAGLANMRSVIENHGIAPALRDIALARSRALDLAAARGFYEKPGKPGWYRESLEAAARLADEYLASLPSSSVADSALKVASSAQAQAADVLASGAASLGFSPDAVKKVSEFVRSSTARAVALALAGFALARRLFR